MIIKKVNLAKKSDVEEFVNFPFRLYRSSEFWVPPLISSVEESLNPGKHPFYLHSTAAFFLATNENNDILGRLAVFDNQNYNHYKGSKSAFFGYFECLDDQQASNALFEAAFDWARKRGLQDIIGPRGLTPGDGGGVLVDGFDKRPIMGISYNYPYYDRLILDAGFTKNTDYLSGYLNRNNALSVRYRRIAQKLATKRGFTVKEFRSKKDLYGWLDRIIEAHLEAFADNHTYFPPTEEETNHLIKTVSLLADYRLVKLALKQDRIAGLLICLPDLARALQKSGGRFWPLGWYRLLLEKKLTKRINVNLLAVLPSYRGLGVIALLYAKLADTFFSSRFEHLELVTVEESNSKAISENEKLGAHWYKRHREYSMAI